MDWIHCNNCFGQLEPGITLHLTSCGHMFCNNCLENGVKESTCIVCRLPCSVMKLVPDMQSEIQDYFTDPEEIIKKSCEVLHFQRQHRRRLLSYLLQSTKKFYTARTELKRMTELCQKQYKQLKENQKYIKHLEAQLHDQNQSKNNATPRTSTKTRSKKNDANTPTYQKSLNIATQSNSQDKTQELGANPYSVPLPLSLEIDQNTTTTDRNGMEILIETPQNSLLSDSIATNSPPLLDVASNVIVTENETNLAPAPESNVLASDSYESIIDYSINSDLWQSSRIKRNVTIPPSETEESSLITIEDLILNSTIDATTVYEQINLRDDGNDEQQHGHKFTESQDVDIRPTSTTTAFEPISHVGQDSKPLHLNIEADDDIAPFNRYDKSESEIDDSDKDATYEPPDDDIAPFNRFDKSESEIDDSDKDATFEPPTSNDDEANDSISVNDSNVNEQMTGSIEADKPQNGRKLSKLREKQKVTLENYAEENEPKRKTRIRTKDHCFFCETEVLNFARHIQRNHPNETEVQNIFSYPKKSTIRKKLFTELRKKGNYLINVSECRKPMKKSVVYPRIEDLPCQKCYGFYSRKQLWKHRKTCVPLATTSSSQVDAQNFMLRNLIVDEKLKNEVFPRMRPDKISLQAKRDPIICEFAAQYLRIHREKHFINVTSRKMRELAKLLLEIKKINNSIRDLMDCLKPQHYDTIVTATKKVAGYDEKTYGYSAPTFAMNISTSLKQCCNIAITATLKEGLSVNTAKIEADLKTLIQIIEANWKFDVSSQASNDLNVKKWNKITIFPLANDLKILKSFLCKKAALASSQLTSTETSNVAAYNTLLETIYCRVILLNRRRPGELQRMLLSTYNCNRNENAYEEFDRAISSTEKMLVNSFKRIVIRGKRGRGVPVLFSDDVQRDINLLVSVRRQYISDTNDYLFAKPGSETPLCGYKVLEKCAKACGAKNPKALTSTKLRKHLATLTQMLNLKETDIEQLANFMGHTQSVHRQNYRLPDDVYQTAKISKLLLLMESGKADNFKGKGLDDIELDMEQNLYEEPTNEEEQVDLMEYDNLETVSQQLANKEDTARATLEDTGEKSLDDISNTDVHTRKKKRNLVPWTTQQKKVVLNFFKTHIKSKRPPKRHECEDLRSQYPDILHNKDWLKIKVFIQNTYTKK